MKEEFCEHYKTETVNNLVNKIYQKMNSKKAIYGKVRQKK